MKRKPLLLAVTPGEPAGIGPDLIIRLCQKPQNHVLVTVADPDLLTERARLLDLPVSLQEYDANADIDIPEPGSLCLMPVPLRAPCEPGILDPTNAEYVLETLELATQKNLQNQFAGLITGPVNKACINEAGIEFTGHTEWLQHRTNTRKVVMMLANNSLKVALATTHLPLKDVSSAIDSTALTQVIRILDKDLKLKFGIESPRILVCGLNPHAGEGGYLGQEEIETIIPVLENLREQGLMLIGPLPADTAFTNGWLDQADAVLAMYHDQGLPVLKHDGFGESVNITLGLPFIRTSVDHGTALDLAGKGSVNIGSLQAAIKYAAAMADNRALV